MVKKTAVNVSGIKKLRDRGWSMEELAKEFNILRQTLYKVLNNPEHPFAHVSTPLYINFKINELLKQKK